MSFKREGDDQSQLNLLKKRRVADLLSNFIPDDEAALIKNGRYTCLVCSHRPVFDTVGVLMVHRKGKRHLEGMKWYYGKKNEIQREVDKRRHQEYVNVESERQEPSSSAPLLTQTRQITHHALLRTTPYSSCHRKARVFLLSERSESPKCGQDDRNDQGSNITLPSNQEPQAGAISATITTVHQDLIEECGKEERGKVKRKKGSSTVECEPPSEQRRRELEHYLKLKSSGWLKDKSGKWVKDGNVEFDSDEDEPADYNDIHNG
ncbi:Sodium channel modifier 1 [Triplophysa tibetana]|uniref:Sodium channel modifier 1 n=1 Tax=Triplophysa tibetana TaxID=1572043 RepID=A0A5A9N2N4_9TELE|nr:Sodium channel modifier 1 [Triplophysa tibetana]